MKLKKYRLEVVLEVRERKKDEAGQFLALRREELLLEEKELENRKNSLEKCRQQIFKAKEQMMTEFQTGTSAGNLVNHKNFLSDLYEDETALIQSIEEQKLTVKKAESAVDDAVEKLIEASKELRIIEKHKEKWSQDKKIELDRNEQKLSDEIGSILHQRSKKL